MSDRSVFGESFDGLLVAAQAGSGWALERLWTALAPRVVGYLLVQGVRDAEDVASEAFLSVFRAITTFSGDEAGFRSWVFTIAHRRLLDARRRAARTPDTAALEHVPELADPTSAETDVLRRLATERVRALCERLGADQRDVLLLRLAGGVTVEEAAVAIGKSPGAVKALQRRGLAGIRRMLEQEGVTL